ncbi:MAG: sulfite exporter TauE/SafE family protein [bacterium]
MDYFLTVLAGFLAGTLGGLLGIGGGVVLMPYLRFYVGLSPAFAAGTCIIAVFFTTLGGSYRHYKLRHIDLRSLLPIIIAGSLSTIICSVLFLQLSQRQSWIDLGVGLVFLFIALRMISEAAPKLRLNQPPDGGETVIRGSIWKKGGIGIVAGIFPGLLGIGTGAILVPAFRFLFRAPIKVAMGSSLVCFACNALWSSIFKINQGFVDFEIAVPICIGALLGANVGAILNRRFPSATLKLFFGLLFLYVSFKFIKNFF